METDFGHYKKRYGSLVYHGSSFFPVEEFDRRFAFRGLLCLNFTDSIPMLCPDVSVICTSVERCGLLHPTG